MSIAVRTALEGDLPAILKADAAANFTHPAFTIPWKSAADCEAVILSRFRFLFNNRNPEYTFLVATAENEVIGYLMYQKPPMEEEQKEWEPNNLPDGTNVRFFEKVMGEVKAAKSQYDLKGYWGT
jgi:hypothetical protein